MNYQNFATFNNRPPMYGREAEPFYDRGSGVPVMDETNMTVQDIYRTPFLFLQEHHKNYKNMSTTALKGIQSESDLSKLFFSDDNMKRIQRKIKQAVFQKTNGEFRLDIDQDQTELFLVMRAIYMEQARFLPGHIVRQVKRLNEKVVSETIGGILTNVKQDYGYLKEINKPLSPIDRPINVNSAGRRQLQSLTTALGF